MSDADDAGDADEVMDDSRDRCGRQEMNLAVDAFWISVAESIDRMRRSIGLKSIGGIGSRDAK